MKQNREKQLLKNTAIITVGRVSTQFISFLLLPLYTALLSTEEYGMVDLITTLVQLIIPLISLMIDQGTFRYLLNCNTLEEKSKVISNAFFVLSGFVMLFSVIYIPVCLLLDYPFKIWLLLILIVTAYSNLYLQVSRGLKQTTDYALGSFVCSAITIIANVFCIAFLYMGALGMLLGTFLGNAVCSCFLFIRLKIYKYVSFCHIDRKVIVDELKYSVPLIPNQLSIWVMNSSDRIIVSLFMGTAANGILAVSHKFPAIYMTIFNIFQLAWHETGAVHFQDEDRNVFFTEMLEKIVAIFATVCMGIIVVLPLIFRGLVNDAYKEAYYNIPIYLIASLFNVVVGFLGVVYVATKRTVEIAKTTMIAAGINIIVNLVLIQFWGLYAASISTFVGYFIAMVYRVIDTGKYIKITYHVKKYVLTTIALIVSTAIYYVDNFKVSLVFLPIFVVFTVVVNWGMLKDVLAFLRMRNQ